jgi:hypothetical protein
MKTKKSTKKKTAPMPRWKVVSTHDIKYGYFTLSEFLKLIKQKVPEGTKDEDILLAVDVDETSGYYDDIIVSAEMEVSVKVEND